MFSYATTKGIFPHGYTLLGAARNIYANGNSSALNDLADREVINTKAFPHRQLPAHRLLRLHTLEIQKKQDYSG